ncbi:hypothetical protein HDE_13231 [Halotydeus destructor]|nr:hypothetical protein HDE_13231 [Halotydeus destructor]
MAIKLSLAVLTILLSSALAVSGPPSGKPYDGVVTLTTNDYDDPIIDVETVEPHPWETDDPQTGPPFFGDQDVGKLPDGAFQDAGREPSSSSTSSTSSVPVPFSAMTVSLIAILSHVIAQLTRIQLA